MLIINDNNNVMIWWWRKQNNEIIKNFNRNLNVLNVSQYVFCCCVLFRKKKAKDRKIFCRLWFLITKKAAKKRSETYLISLITKTIYHKTRSLESFFCLYCLIVFEKRNENDFFLEAVFIWLLVMNLKRRLRNLFFIYLFFGICWTNFFFQLHLAFFLTRAFGFIIVIVILYY